MTALGADALRVVADDGVTTLLDGVSLDVAPGETLLVCGPSGSGKTVLAKALTGLLDSREDLAVEGALDRDGDVGFVFQYPARQLVRRTVRLDVGFGLENRGVEAEEIAGRVEQIAARFDATELLDRKVAGLSAGETTVVALLGVLVTEPDVVILDEPLSTLDLPGTRRLLDAIDELRARGTTVVIVEHDLRDLLVRADRVVALAAGRVTAEGRPAAVAPTLDRLGLKLPFGTRVAIARGTAGEGSIPLAADGSEGESP